MKISKKIKNTFVFLSLIGIGIIVVSSYSKLSIKKSKDKIEGEINSTREILYEYSSTLNILDLMDTYNSLLSSVLRIGYIDNTEKLKKLNNDYKYYFLKIKNLSVKFENKDQLIKIINNVNNEFQKLLELKRSELKLREKYLEKIEALKIENQEIGNKKISSKIIELKSIQGKMNSQRMNSINILEEQFNLEIGKLKMIVVGTSINQNNKIMVHLNKIGSEVVKSNKISKKVDSSILSLVLFNLITLILLFYFVMYKSVINPLDTLGMKLVNIEENSLNEEINIEIKNDDEIGDLTRIINEMLRKIKILYTQLSNQKRDLKIKVTQRTVELAKSNKILNESLKTLKGTQKKLIEKEKMASLGGLVAGVAHEVNTPIGVGVTAASYLKDEAIKIDEKYKNQEMTQNNFEDFLEISVSSSKILLTNLKKASDLVRNFKKVAVDQTSEHKREFELKKNLEELSSSLYYELKKQKHTIEIIGAEDIKVNSYPGVFSQIFSILIMNSVIHAFEGKKGGKILINFKKNDNDFLKIVYTDNGRGVSAETKKKMFDPFFTTKRGNGGSGLGMHILYNLITQKLNGEIELKSELGKGVEFVMMIPDNIIDASLL